MINIEKLISDNQSIKLDIACGASKNQGFVGLDMQDLPGVDIVWDLMRFPWPIPDECVSLAVASHILEHVPPDMGDSRVEPLINLLIKKKVLSTKEVLDNIGDIKSAPRFIRFMNEIWRVMKPDGELMISAPYAGSAGDFWDPTHINHINEYTWSYFDPLDQLTGGMFYKFYRPKPWKKKINNYDVNRGMIEVVLIKRRMDKSYE